MRRRSFLVGILTTVAAAGAVKGDTLPRKGTFTGYFFVDRWGQGWFDFLFVADDLKESVTK